MATAPRQRYTPEASRLRLAGGASVSYLRGRIHGAIDGSVRTLAIVAGVVGANLPSAVVVLLGFANLVAYGFAIAASNYSGMAAEREGYGPSPAARSPALAGLSTFAAFILCGIIPLVTFLAVGGLVACMAATGATLFGLGAIKSRGSTVAWWQSGLETLAIGMGAAVIAFATGYGLRMLFHTASD